MTQIVKTEGQHPGEWLLSEAEGTLSREVGTLANGYAVSDGDVVMLVAGKLKPHDGDIDTNDLLVTPVEGIVIGDHDATAGPTAGLTGVPYIARLAEVKDELIGYPEEHTDTEGGLGQKASVVYALRHTNFIRTR